MEISYITVGCFLLFVYFIYKLFHRSRASTDPPGPTGFPVIGSGLQIDPAKAHLQFYDLAKTHGNIFKIQLFNTTSIVLNTSELIHKAFVRDWQVFNDRPDVFYSKHVDTMETSLVLRHLDKKHDLERKALSKSFQVYGNNISNVENNERDGIGRLMDEIGSHRGVEFEVTDLIKRSFFNQLSIMMTGNPATSEDTQMFLEFIKDGDYFLNAYTNTLLSNLPFLRHLPFYKRRINRTVDARRKLGETYFTNIKEKIFSMGTDGIVQELMRFQETNREGNNNRLTDEMIESIIINDVFAAGVLTTAVVIQSIILCLVTHDQCQKRLQDELDTYIGDSRKPSLSDKSACPYLEAVIKETMRFITINPFSLPHVCKQDTQFEGFTIKAKTQIFPNIWFVHHNEAIWGDPWTFRPERFLGEDGKLLPSNHVFMKNCIPSGFGPRKCPGFGMATSRMFLCIATIFQKYTLEAVPGKCGSCDPRSDDFVFELFVKPKPFYCVARERRAHHD